MRVFISWSKEPSRTVALALRNWLPDINNAIKPWMSAADIGAGRRWSAEIAQELANTKVGILCISSENQHEPWVHFEAGALAKSINDDTLVCPYLLNLAPSDVQGPLAQFQANVADREGTLKLVTTINRALADQGLSEERLKRSFEHWWRDLEAKLAALPRAAVAPTRTQEDMLGEVLETVRGIARRLPEQDNPWQKGRVSGTVVHDRPFLRRQIYDSVIERLGHEFGLIPPVAKTTIEAMIGDIDSGTLDSIPASTLVDTMSQLSASLLYAEGHSAKPSGG